MKQQCECGAWVSHTANALWEHRKSAAHLPVLQTVWFKNYFEGGRHYVEMKGGLHGQCCMGRLPSGRPHSARRMSLHHAHPHNSAALLAAAGLLVSETADWVPPQQAIQLVGTGCTRSRSSGVAWGSTSGAGGAAGGWDGTILGRQNPRCLCAKSMPLLNIRGFFICS